jgi:hypothetical protein
MYRFLHTHDIIKMASALYRMKSKTSKNKHNTTLCRTRKTCLLLLLLLLLLR